MAQWPAKLVHLGARLDDIRVSNLAEVGTLVFQNLSVTGKLASDHLQDPPPSC